MGRTSAILLVIAAIALPSIGSAQHKLYKWTDANGQVHYSETIPPEYGDLPEYSPPESSPPEYTDPEYDGFCFLLISIPKCPTDRGAVRGVITPEDDAAERARGSAAEADKRAKQEIARRDRMLIETYRSVDDIEDLRDRRLELIESQINLTKVYLDNLRMKLAGLQAEASNYKPYSTREDAPPIPEDLARDISQTEASINSYEQTLARQRADQEALKKQFDDDIARFRQLKGV